MVLKELVYPIAFSFGQAVLSLCDAVGRFSLFVAQAARTCCCRRPHLNKLLAQMNAIGVNSFSVIFLTGLFSGMVFALQTYIGFQRVGGTQYIGSVVALAITRELGPVLTGLMVAGRAGSAITAELGFMRITEQIDALTTLCINPFQYLVVPRMLAGVLVLPCLALFSMAFGVFGGYFMCVNLLGLSPEDYVGSIRSFVELRDVMSGIFKAGVFGFVLTAVASYKGYYAQGGARGVGIATTESVVLSSVTILIVDCILTKLLGRL